MDCSSSGPLGQNPSLRSLLEALQAHLHQPIWDAERITLDLARLHPLLAERLAQQTRRYENALGATPWIAPSVRDLGRCGMQLRAALEHLQMRWAHRHACPDPIWREAFNDFALQLVEHEAHEWQLREEAFPTFHQEEPLDPLASG